MAHTPPTHPTPAPKPRLAYAVEPSGEGMNTWRLVTLRIQGDRIVSQEASEPDTWASQRGRLVRLVDRQVG